MLLFMSRYNYAQNNAAEIKAGAGYLSDEYLKNLAANALWGFLLFFLDHVFAVKTSGIYSADALVTVKNMGLQAGFSYEGERIYVTEINNGQGTYLCQAVNSTMASFQYKYFKGQKHYFYSGIDLGIKTGSMVTTNNNEQTVEKYSNLAYHLNTVDYHCENEIVFFIEPGFGAKGLMQAGALSRY